METLTRHWTESNTQSFTARIASDFVLQLEKKLEKENLTHASFASLLGLTEGSISQFFNTPGNFGIERSVKYARALGMKIAVVAYEDGDPENSKGPVSSEVFLQCWKNAGRPEDLFAFETTQRVNLITSDSQGTFGVKHIVFSLERLEGTQVRKAS